MNVQGYTARESLAVLGLAPAVGGLRFLFWVSVSFVLPKGSSLLPRWTGGSVKCAKERNSNGMGYAMGEKFVI